MPRETRETLEPSLDSPEYVKHRIELAKAANARLQELANAETGDSAALRRLDKGGARCGQCGTGEPKGGKMLQCSRCQAKWYCSPECQKAAWPEHKKGCTQTNKVNDLVEEIAMEFPTRSSAYGQLHGFKSLVDVELHAAMACAMRIGHPDDLHLTHSGYFVFEFHESAAALRDRYKLVKAGVETKEDGVKRIMGGTMDRLKDESAIRHQFTMEDLRERTKSNPPLPQSHPFVVTIQVIGDHKHPGQPVHTGTIGAITGPFNCSLSERITVLAKPPRCDDWLRALDLSLSLPQPAFGASQVDILFGIVGCGGADAYWNYYKEYRAYQAKTDDCEAWWTPSDRSSMGKRVQGLISHVDGKIKARWTEMQQEDEGMRKTVANQKKKLRKERSKRIAAGEDLGAEAAPEPNINDVLLRHRARKLDCMGRV